MSFILDALKKSEAERRQGEVPRLQNEPPSPPPRRRHVWPFLLILALLLNGAVFGWWILSREEPKVNVAAVPLAPSTGTVDPGTAGPAPAEKPAVSAAAGESAVPPKNAPTDDAPAGSDTLPQRAKERPELAEPEVKTVVLGTSPPAPASPAVSPDSADAGGRAVAALPGESPPPAPKPLKVAARPVVESYPPLAELPGNVRSGLPGLVMQLHFFTSEPQRRMIRLNGSNLREGDRSGDGLSVVEITQEGVRLAYGGTRFFLPAGRR